MFQRAVEKHQPAQNVAGNKLAPYRNSSQQSSIQSAFKSSQPPKPTLAQRAPGNQAFVVSASAKTSTSTHTSFCASMTTRNRLSDTNGSLVNTLNNVSAFQETCLITPCDTQTSGLATLHSSVYFEEDDFVDDDELELALHEIIPPDLKAAASALRSCSSTKPTPLPTPPEVIDLEVPQSSGVLIPWSSSPISHFGPPGLVSSTAYAPTKVYCQETTSQQRKSESISVPKPAPPKPRRLPMWNNTDFGASASTLPKPGRRYKTETPSKVQDFTTPEPKKEKAQYAWDSTFSAYQAAKKEYKVKGVTQKRSITTVSTGPQACSKKPKIEILPQIFLSEEQRSVLNLVVEGSKSAFFTGSAGTGKSVLMREIISQLRMKYKDPERIAVTASTGLAACNVGGVTLHSFGGIGLGREAAADLVRKIRRNPKAKNRWLRTKVLIIDEISMVDGELFDKLEGVARMMRNNGRPFGGIQLVITGDFFQLPPVPEDGKIQKFAFEAETWNTCIEHTIGLTHVFRQRDPVFAGVLNQMRLGNLSDESCELFKRLSRPLEFNDGLEATELFPTRQEVERANNQRMAQLPGGVTTYYAEDSGTITDKVQRDKLLSNCMAPARIDLKVNSQVMLIKNMDESLVNGSLGRVTAFMNEKTFDLTNDESELNEAGEDQGGEDALVRRQKRIKAKILEQQAADTSRKWPLVQFTIPDGTTRQLLVQPEAWKIELPNGEIQAQRSQLPLILAWALSIHKAQGQTLERVKVDLGKTFEKGQAYVALSRATCQEGLQVLRFDKSKVKAHDKVRQFYASLYSAQDAHKRTGATKTTKTIMPPNPDEFPDSDEEALRAFEGAY